MGESRFLFYTDAQYEEAKNNTYFAEDKVGNNDYFCLCDVQYNTRGITIAGQALVYKTILLAASMRMKNICEEVVSSGEMHEALLPYIEFFNTVGTKVDEVFNQYGSLISKFVNEIDEIDEVVYSKSKKENIIRDFSKEKEERLKRKLEDGNSKHAHTWGNFIDNVINRIKYKEVGWIERNLLGTKINSDGYMAKVLKYNDVTKRRLADIFKRAREADKQYALYFTDLYNDFHKVFMLVWKALRIFESKELSASGEEIQRLLTQCNEIQITDYMEVLRNYPTDEEVVAFAENNENREFFTDYEGPLYEEAYNGPGAGEIFDMVLYQGKAVAKSTIYKSLSVPPDVSIADTYQYLAIKKHLASLIQSIADQEKDPNSGYEKAKEVLEKYKWKDKAKDNPDFAVYTELYNAAFMALGKAKDKYKNLKGINELFTTVGKGYDFTTDGIEILLPIFAEYERNRKIIASLKNGDSTGSLTDIAIEQLEREYTDQFKEGMEQFFFSVFEELEKEEVGDLKKEFLKIAGKNAKGLYSAVDLSIKVVGELSGLSESSGKQLEFYSIFQVNDRLRSSYQKNFDIIASGNYSEDDMLNLRNSFTLLRDSYVKEYQLLAKSEGIHGNYDKMEYYDYLARTLKKKTMKDCKQGILSQNEYLHQLQ